MDASRVGWHDDVEVSLVCYFAVFWHSFEISFLGFGFDPHAVVRVRDTVDCVVLLHEVPPEVSVCTVLHANSMNMHCFTCKLEERAPFCVRS